MLSLEEGRTEKWEGDIKANCQKMRKETWILVTSQYYGESLLSEGGVSGSGIKIKRKGQQDD